MTAGTAAAGTEPEVLLEVANLAKHFGGIRAVRDGNLVVHRGEMHGLVGPNGCGKSTMLNVVSGVLLPDAGTVTFEGRAMPLGHYRRTQSGGVFLVPQELAVAPADYVWESITLGGEASVGGWINRRDAKETAARALDLIGHPMNLDAQVGSLTPVEQRLVTIARGAARQNVKLLILDEPTAGLPHEDAVRVMRAMAQLVSEHRSLLVVSHHINEIVDYCQTVSVMRDGVTVRRLVGEEISADTIIGLLLAGVTMPADAQDARQSARVTGEPLVSMEDVHGKFLRGVTLTAHRGEVVGIAGILGSGVDEVVDLAIGRRKPGSGTVGVGATKATPRSPYEAFRAGLGYLSGDRSKVVIKGMSVLEHVTLPAVHRFRRGGLVSRRREAESVQPRLRQLSVKGDSGAVMTSLSGGNQQRALLARWVDGSIDVLVADQPTVGVDIAGRMQLLGAIREMSAERAVLLAAEPEELAAICDRVICLRRGLIVQELTGDDVTEGRILQAIA